MTEQQTAEAHLEELLLSWEEVFEQGQVLPAEELCSGYPKLVPLLQQRIDALLEMNRRLDAAPSPDCAVVEAEELKGRVDYATSLTVLRQHGEGGISEVYASYDAALKREVALKALKPALCSVSSRRQRFLREAEISGQLEHPGIVPVHGQGLTTDGRPFYTMRLVRGRSLEEVVRESHARGVKGLQLRVLLRHMISVCRTVHYAHSRRVLHCDIKPLNIMVGKYGETFLLDWGEAMIINPQSLATEGAIPAVAESLSPGHSSLGGGTLLYMPPERIDGQNRPLTSAADVYSLGATLFKVLTGQDAFQADSRSETMRRIKAGEFPQPRSIKPNLPSPLESIIRKALSVEPEARYLDAGPLADELQAWLDDEPVSCHRESLPERLTRWARRHRTLAMSSFVVLIAAIVTGSLLTIAASRSAQRREQDLAMTAAAHESGLRAFARFAATQLERDVDASWKTLEAAAADKDLPRLLRASEADQKTPRELQTWLQELYDAHYGLLAGSSWFVLDAHGEQLGRFPQGQFSAEVNRIFAHKTYFHGEDQEYPQGTNRPPLTKSTVSPVFFSSSDACRKIAYSVPIWPDAKREGTPLGVLVMTVRLGDVKLLDIDVADGIDRHAVLIDIRQDWEQRTGTVLQHPAFREDKIKTGKTPMLEESLVERLSDIAQRDSSRREKLSLVADFHDPVLHRTNLSIAAPVTIRDRAFGWFVIVEEAAEAKPASK